MTCPTIARAVLITLFLAGGATFAGDITNINDADVRQGARDLGRIAAQARDAGEDIADHAKDMAEDVADAFRHGYDDAKKRP